MALRNFYHQDIVEVDGQLFESVDVAIEYITENWMDFLGIGKYDFDRPELTEVVREEKVAMITVRYIRDLDEEDSELHEVQMIEESFDIKFRELTVKVPELHLI